MRFLLLSGIVGGGLVFNFLPNYVHKNTQVIKFNLRQSTIVTHVDGNLSSELSFNVLPKNIYVPKDFEGIIPINNAIEYLKDDYETNTDGQWNLKTNFAVGVAKAVNSNNLRFD